MGKIETERRLYEDIWERKAKYIKNSPLPLRVIAGAELASGGKRLLDIGCGDGSLAIQVKEKYDEVYGIEFSDKAAELAKEKGVIVSISNLNYESLPYEDCFFDTAVCLDIIEHIFDPARLVKETLRILRPGGCIILSTPNIRYIYCLIPLIFKGRFPKTSSDLESYDGGHIHYFTFKDVELLLGDVGFKKIEKFGLFQWESFNFAGKIKDIIKNIFGRNFKREFFSSGVIVRATKT